MYALICFLIFMTGSCFGSFLHVCLNRHGWMTGRSRCDYCQYILKWFDLIPIFSFLCFGGKCRKCREKISVSHFVSEIMMGASFLCSFFCWQKYGCEFGILVLFGLCFMSAAAIQDVLEKMIYRVILYGGIIGCSAAKFLYLYMNSGYVIIVKFLAIVFILKMVFILFSELAKDKIGDGDFDLFIIMYCICGGYGAVFALTMACIIGCLIYLPLILIKKENRKKQLPFAPLLLAGTISELLLNCVF